jgi:hypothetical protein
MTNKIRRFYSVQFVAFERRRVAFVPNKQVEDVIHVESHSVLMESFDIYIQPEDAKKLFEDRASIPARVSVFIEVPKVRLHFDEDTGLLTLASLDGTVEDCLSLYDTAVPFLDVLQELLAE